jgi:hypothetical protein
MSNLLEKVLHAHGGLDNWQHVKNVDFRLTFCGEALAVKQQPQGLRDVLVKIDARHPRVMITPFPVPGSRGVFENGQVRIETEAGVEISSLAEARKTFEGYTPTSPWNELQFLYFVSYALRNYMTMPFLLASDGVRCEEIDAHEEHGERWRVLKVTFPGSVEVHCAEQKFYFNETGYLVRNDYSPEVSRGMAAHYTFDHKTFDGFIVPTHRRVVFRDANGHTHLTGPSIFRLDIESVVIS